MDFTYDGYLKLIKALLSHGYEVSNYHDWDKKEHCVILRHDIDYDVDSALNLAQIEAEKGAISTYFILLSSDFYNPHSTTIKEKIHKISQLGHEVGLHYDEKAYPDDIGNIDKTRHNIIQEGNILSDILGERITTVSMHRPSKSILDADIEIPGYVNSYGKTFFRDFKYVSDSRRRWREPVEEYIENETYDRLHILTHAFWYNEEEKSLTDTIKSYLQRGSIDRYDVFNDNFTSLDEIVKRDDFAIKGD